MLLTAQDGGTQGRGAALFPVGTIYYRGEEHVKLGIDFGTTRIVTAAADRGNYPLLTFDTREGNADWFPSLVALRGDERRYGWDAWTVQGEPGWTAVRSLKRILEDAGAHTSVEVDGARYPLMELLTGMIADLRRGLSLAPPLEVMLGVPANANSNQRFLTVEAFRRAGFQVLGLLNEPSAAAIEFGHSQKIEGRLLVYDLGGGTFDASLVELDDKTHTVVASAGIGTLGGDDFDHLLAEMAVGEAVLGGLSGAELFRLLEECRRQKEALHPNTRKIAVDLDHVREGWGQVTIPAPAYYERCRPLVEETIRTVSSPRRGSADPGAVRDGRRERAAAGGPDAARGVRAARAAQHLHALGDGDRPRDPGGRVVGLCAAGRVLAQLRRVAGGRGRAPDDVRRDLPARHAVAGTGRAARSPCAASISRCTISGTCGTSRRAAWTASGQPAGDIAVWDDVLFPLDPALADARAPRARPRGAFRGGGRPADRGALRLQCGGRARGDDQQPDVALHAPVHPRAVVGEGHRGHRSGSQARAPVTRDPYLRSLTPTRPRSRRNPRPRPS